MPIVEMLLSRAFASCTCCMFCFICTERKLAVHCTNRARNNLASWAGGITKLAWLNSTAKLRGGTACHLDNASASSLASTGMCFTEYCHRRTIRRHAISRAMLFMPAAVELRLSASLRAPKLSPRILAPIVANSSSNVTATINNVRYSNEVWKSEHPRLAFNIFSLKLSHTKCVYLTSTILPEDAATSPWRRVGRNRGEIGAVQLFSINLHGSP